MRAEAGTAPSEGEFFEFVQGIEVEWTEQEWRNVWDRWRASQQPSIPIADLADLVRASRESIYDIYLKYQVSQVPLVKESKSGEWHHGKEFAAAGDKLLLKTVKRETLESPRLSKSRAMMAKWSGFSENLMRSNLVVLLNIYRVVACSMILMGP